MPNIIRTGSVSDNPDVPSSNEWKPHPDWWDIKQIFEDDIPPVGYEKAFIVLSDDSEPFSIFANNNAYRTSDGKDYISNTTVNHTWDITYDKPCSLGYSTRYVIFYQNTNQTRVYIRTYIRALYIYIGEGQISQFEISSSTNGPINPCLVEAVEYHENLIWNISTFPNYCFSTASRLKKFKIPNNITTLSNNCFRLTYNLESLTIPSSVTNIGDSCFLNTGVKSMKIESSEFTSNVNSFANSYINSIEVPQDFNSTIALTSSSLSRRSLVGILNNLKDLTGDTSKTLTLSTANLAKLSEEEKEIATDKNWILA